MVHRIDDPNSGFPWERVKAAKRYLYAVKPWWARFGEKLVIVPTYVQPQEGKKYGSITSTDQSFRLYIDRTFASQAPLHFLAGAIEHEFQHHTRDTWRRLTWLSPDDWREHANIAIDLEINSGIDAEQQKLDLNKIFIALKNSLIFTQSDFRNWDVTAPPGLDDEGWIPRLIPLPEGLSAEEYLKLLQKSQEMYDDEALSEKSDDAEDWGEEDDDKQSQGIGDAAGGENPGAPGQQQDSDEDSEEESEGEGSSGQQSQSSEGEAGEDSDAEGDKDSEDSEGEPSAANSGSGSDSDADGSDDGDPSEGDPDDAGEPDDASSEAGGSGNGAQGDGNPSDSDSGASTEPGQGGGEVPTSGGEPSPEIAKAIEEMRKEGHNEAWANEIENPKDPLSDPQWKPEQEDNAKPLTIAEIAEAYKELEEDVSEAVHGIGNFGLDAGNELVKWASDYRRSHGMNWDSRFTRLVSAAFTSAKIKGQSDLSYSTRNPNQQPLGVILQGMHTYSPNVYVLQDVSGSMRTNNAMKKSMSAFTEICAKVMGHFGERTTWITADAKIQSIGKASGWSEDLKAKWSYGYGGTDFGDVIFDIIRGKLEHEGKKYPKADLLIVSTDCAFEWPKHRPKGNCKILVVSVGQKHQADEWLPAWIDRRREFVQID